MIESLVEEVSALGIVLYEKNGKLAFVGQANRFTPQLKAQVAEHKLAILEFLRSRSSSSAQRIEHEEHQGGVELSFSQQRLWFIDRFQDGQTAQYNLVNAFEVAGNFDPALAERVLKRIIERHEILRCVYRQDGSQPQQFLQSADNWQLTRHDLSHLQGEDQQQAVDSLIAEDAGRSFDLSCDVKLRALWISLAPNRSVVVFNIHHIASDGQSMDIFNREFTALYLAFAKGLPDPLPPLPIQYSDYARWQRQHMQGQALEGQLNYWRKQLSGAPDVHSLPLDRPRSAVAMPVGAQWQSVTETSLTGRLEQLALARGVTPFMLMHGVFSLLLARLGNSSDVLIGTPVNNRPLAELENLMGFFVNTLVLRTDCAGASTFGEFLASVKQVNLDALSHQNIGFEQLVDELNIARSTTHAPLFQIMLSVTKVHHGTLPLADMTFDYRPGAQAAARFDIELQTTLSAQGIGFNWIYDATVLDESTVRRMDGYLHRVLVQVLENPDIELAAVDLLSDDERRRLLVDFNDNAWDYSHLPPVTIQLEQTAAREPTQTALAGAEGQLDYRQFSARVNRLAHYLMSLGAEEGQIVALALPRSFDMVIAIWAVLKTGAAYLPLSPEQPAARLASILEEAQPLCLLAHQAFAPVWQQIQEGQAPLESIRPLWLDTPVLKARLDEQPEHDCAVIPSSVDACAYVIYTSGSTGKPKGVLCTHRGLINGIDCKQRRYPLAGQAVVLQKTPYTFDVSLWELIWPLVHGATLVVAKDGGHKDPAYLAAVIAQYRVSMVHFVPSMLEMMLEQHGWQGCESVEQVICIGEPLSKKLQTLFFAQATRARLHNVYGPTEAAIDVSCWECRSDSLLADVPIGRPIENTQLVLLDDNLNPVPLGCIGQLYIGGDNLALGYLNRPELTEARFIDSPLAEFAGRRLYQSGDLARLVVDELSGQLQLLCLGRADDQIKLRGQRIELGEIAAVLSALDDVVGAVAKVFHLGAAQARIVAYATVRPGSEDFVRQSWRAALMQSLPDYMIPSALVLVEQWPLTASGKIDKNALSEPDIADLGGRYVEPRNELERRLCEIWQTLLQLDRVGVEDNFFALGGNSMQAVALIGAAREAGILFTMVELWQHQSIAELAPIVRLSEISDKPAEAAEKVTQQDEWLELLPAQQRLLGSGHPNPSHFNTAMLVEVPLHIDLQLLGVAVDQLVDGHQALTMQFVQRPQGWRQRKTTRACSAYQIVDLSRSDEADVKPQMQQQIARLQGSLNIAKGDLLRICVFDFGPDKPRQLLFICHHLVTDGFSTGLIIERLTKRYLQLQAGQEGPLPWKDDYAEAIFELKRLANSDRVKAELSYWDRYIPDGSSELPRDFEIQAQDNTCDALVFAQEQLLCHEATRTIIKSIVVEHKIQSVAVVLYAMSRVFQQNDAAATLLVGMGRLGREVGDGRMDLSQTLGWHAMTIPIQVHSDGVDDLGSIRALDAQLRHMPNSGSHYGLLRYLCDDARIQSVLTKKSEPNVTLNYFPDDPDDDEPPLFKPVDMSLDPYIDPSNCNDYDMTFWVRVIDGQLGVNIQYSNKRYRPETIEGLIGRCIEALARVADRLQ